MFIEQLDQVLSATPKVGGLVIKLEKIIVLLFVSLFALAVLRNAWLYDDAYITFRTVDNFVNGYGLTWNTAERVQTYTHPLWMFLLSAVYFFTHEIFFSSLFLCIAVSVAAVLLFAFGMAESILAALLGITILTFSKAFVDYSTSGLENPLTHLLLAVFFYLYLKTINQPTLNLKTLFWLALITALGALNRMDTILLFLPALAYAWLLASGGLKNLLTVRPVTLSTLLKGLLVIVAGFTPFILWEFFSFFYYGFPFPNTAYAKLNTDVDKLALAQQGLYYLLNSLQIDPLTLLTIVTSLTTPFITRKWSNLPLVAGIALYLLYIIRIGGDFMTGRFLTGPLFVSVILLLSHASVRSLPLALGAPFRGVGRFSAQPPLGTLQCAASPWDASRFLWIALFTVVLLVGALSPYPPLLCDVHYGASFEREELRDQGIQDGRGIYYQYSGLLNALQNPGDEWPNHSWAVKGREARRQGPAVIERGAIGYFGFYAGPEVHIIDRWALADPLLARLPAMADWQIGHFTRSIPSSYLATLRSGQNLISDKNLAAYYDKLSLVTRGPLFDLNRLSEIWNLNTGKYDDLLAAYPAIFQVDLSASNLPSAGEPFWSEADNLAQYAGIQLNLSRPSHAQQMEISLVQRGAEPATADQRSYQLIYFNGKSAVADETLQVPEQIPEGGLIRTIEIPSAATTAGYDQIKIFPERGDSIGSAIYSIEWVRLLE